MARHFGLTLKNCATLFTTLLNLNLVTAISFGQATPCCNPPTYTPPSYTPTPNVYQPMPPNPSNTWNPGSTSAPDRYPSTSVDLVKAQDRYLQYTPPNPYVSPTPRQTEWYVNNHPVLSTLDWGTRQQLINGGWQAANILNQQYLGSRENPFYQNGRVIPNWYLPSTWSGGNWSASPNWYNVQPNGFAPSNSSPSYNPTFGSNGYRSSVAPSYYQYQQTYRPPPQPISNNPPQTTVPPFRPEPVSSLTTSNVLSPAKGPSAHDFEKAIADRERALALHETAGDKLAQVIDRSQLAELLLQGGQPEQALPHIRAAEAITGTQGDPLLRLQLLRLKDSASMSAGNFEDAIAAQREAMKILRSLHDENGQAEMYTNSGWAFQSLGNTSLALSSYEAALALFSRHVEVDAAVKVRIAIGSLYQSIGDIDNALKYYERAFQEASKIEQARILAKEAEIALSWMQPRPALVRYKRALSLLDSEHERVVAGNTTSDIALESVILAGLGRCYMTLGSFLESRYYLEAARLRMEDAGNRVGEAAIVASLGELDYWVAISSPGQDPTRRYKRALANYTEALGVMRSFGDRLGEIGILTNTGLVFDAWGKLREATGYYTQALQKMDELQASTRLEEFRTNIASQSVALYQRAVFIHASLHHDVEAFELSERARARTFLDQLGNRRIRVRNTSSQEFAERERQLRSENIALERQVGQELSKPGPEVNFQKIASLQSRLSDVRARHRELMERLKIASPEYASFLSVSPLTLRGVQQQLGSEVTLVSYYTTPWATFAFVITRDSFQVSKLDVSESELAWTVNTLLDFAGENSTSRLLQSLHGRLIAPIKSHLKTSTLGIVPYGVLHEVPFAALSDGKQALASQYVLFSLPSVSTLPYIRTRMSLGGNNAFVVANSGEQGLPYLGQAYDEARSVASLLNTQAILGSGATTSVIAQEAGKYEIVHLIGHVDLDTDNPAFSRIVLSDNPTRDGRFLDIDQIYDLELSRTQLVVLSTCQSQWGKRSKGDDVVSLSRAFMYAGSPTVLASLWNVDDQATKELMLAFYTHLNAGLSKAEALRAAQLDMQERYANPYYWAGFVLTGDPGNPKALQAMATSKTEGVSPPQ